MKDTPEVACLAHEGVHVQEGPPDSSNAMLQQEYACHAAQAQVWQAIKGNETDLLNDDVAQMIASGKIDALAQILNIYGPEYFDRWDQV